MTRRRAALPLGDGPPREAAKMLGLSADAFASILPRLLSRGFPAADPDTLLFDLDAIAEWRRRRHPHLFPESLASRPAAIDARGVVRARLEQAFG